MGGRFGCPVQLYSRGRFGCPVQLVGGEVWVPSTASGGRFGALVGPVHLVGGGLGGQYSYIVGGGLGGQYS